MSFVEQSRRAVILPVSLAVLAVLGTGAPVASAATPPPCRVTNTTTDIEYVGQGHVLQAAIDAATSGDSLKIIGTCVGQYTIGKDLTLRGKSLPKFATPMLDGNGIGRVLTVSAGTVVIRNLTIVNGLGSFVPLFGPVGGGIFNQGVMTLTDSTVSGNTALMGGGIFNTLSSTLTIGNSTVSGNTAGRGGGIFNAHLGTLTVTDSAVSGNSAQADAGGIFNNDSGTVTLRDSAVSGNRAGGFCGGIFNPLFSTATLTNSTVSGNTAGFDGGGICNEATLTLTYSMVSRNTAGGRGGGVFIGPSGTVTLAGATDIQANRAFSGGGIFAIGALSIVTAAPDWSGSVSGNFPDDCEPDLVLGATLCT